MANKIELLKTKVQESKNDFEVLKKTDKEQLEKEKIQEKYEKIKEVKKELQTLKTDTLMSNDPEIQKELSQMENDLSNLEKEFLSQFNLQLSNLRQEVDKSQEEKKEVTDTEEKGRFRRQRDGVTSKEEWKEHTLTNVGRVVMGVGAAALVYKGIKWIKGLFSKKEEDKKENSEGENKEKKPRYKRWYTRLGAGILGFLGIKYGKDFLKRFEGLFGGDSKKRDKAFEQIANNLGKDYTYDSNRRVFVYRGREYSVEKLVEAEVIKTTINENGEAIVDVEATQEALKNYISNDTDTQSDGSNLINTTETSNEREKLPETSRSQYGNIANQINKFSSDKLSYSPKFENGFMLYHIDYFYNNIGHILNEKTFDNFLDATTTDLLETIFGYFPKELIQILIKSSSLVKGLGLDAVAAGSANLANTLSKMRPEQKDKTRKWCVNIFEQRTSIASYSLAIRNTYEEKVSGNETKMKSFDESKLSDLYIDGEKAKNDKDLHDAIENPLLDDDIESKIKKSLKNEKNLTEKLSKSKDSAEKKEVIESLIGEIDDVGYKTWSAAFSLIRGHLWETDSYIAYDIISKQYDEYLGGMKKELQQLLKKDKYSDEDIQKIKQDVSDFYATMRKVSTQVELKQETDEDGNLYAAWKLPIIRAGKLSYQTFCMYQENGQWVLAAATLATIDIVSMPLRKILALLTKKWVGYSPTFWIMKKIGKPLLALTLNGSTKAGATILKTPIRNYNRFINKYPRLRYSRFSSPEDLTKAIDIGYIRLSDAAELVASKSKGKYLGIAFDRAGAGGARRNLGLGNDILSNKKILLQQNKRLFNQIPQSSKDRDLLAKYRDHPDWVKKFRNNKMTGNLFNETMKTLREFDRTGVIPSRINNIASSVESASSSFDDMTESINKSKKSMESKIADIFADFDKEVAEEARKLNLKKGSSAYKKLANKIRESSNYKGNKIVQELIEQHNILTKTTEKNLLKKFNSSDRATKQKLYSENPILKRIIDANGGIEKRKLPGRTGRIISIGVHSLMLGRIGSSDDEEGHKKDRKTIGGEAADFGFGMIPVAGGVYDIGMAFRGKDLNGREMGTAERWIRGGAGLLTGALDVFTFGMGGTAIRGILKGGTKIALKAGSKKLATEGAEVVSESVIKGFAKQTLKNAGRDIIIGTTAGLALIPVLNSFDKDKLEE